MCRLYGVQVVFVRGVSMEVISGIVFSICLLILFCIGYFFGYRNGMETMKRIDDNIIEEAKRVIYGEE